MVTGFGFLRTVGRGLVMNHGVGLRTTMVDGFTTTVVGRGVREVVTTVITPGGDPRWLRSITSTTTIVGTHSDIISAIHDRVTTTTNLTA